MKWNPATPMEIKASSARKRTFRLNRAFTAVILARCAVKRNNNALPIQKGRITERDWSLIAPDLHLVRHELLHLAVTASVTEVDEHSNSEPDDQTKPRVSREAGHQGEGNHNTQDGNQGHQRGLEGTMQFRAAHPENPHTGAYDDERQQRSDAHQFAKNPDGDRSEEH